MSHQILTTRTIGGHTYEASISAVDALRAPGLVADNATYSTTRPAFDWQDEEVYRVMSCAIRAASAQFLAEAAAAILSVTD